MKNKLFANFFIIIIFSIFITTPVSAAQEQSSGYQKKLLNAYALNSKTPSLEINCLFREDLPAVPFISTEDFLNQLFSTNVSVSENNGTFTFTNDEYHMIIDTKKDIISFDCFEAFSMRNQKAYFEGDNPAYMEDGDAYSVVGTINEVELDLSQYNIDIIGADGKAYLPFCTLNDLFADTDCAVQMKSDGLHFISASQTFSKDGGIKSTETNWDKTMAAFTYHELCFMIDKIYGKPSNAILSESIRTNGLDKTLLSYDGITPSIRELLLSDSMENFCTGIRLLDFYLDDGGHTYLSYGLKELMRKYEILNTAATAKKLYSKTNPDEVRTIIEFQNNKVTKNHLYQSLLTEKNHTYDQYQLIKQWEDASLYQAGDMFIFDFNEFNDSVVEPFKWSMDYADEKAAAFFLIDLSTNVGGADSVANYMVSLLYGQDTHSMKSELSGNILRSESKIDKNLDGQFDEKDDAVKYDFYCAIITSQYSFSMSAQMPCFAQDNGIAIVGETGGGGCCNITPRFFPDGTMYLSSGSLSMIRPNGEDPDKGASPDIVLPGEEMEYHGFYNMKAIHDKISQFYKEHETIQTSKEESSVNEIHLESSEVVEVQAEHLPPSNENNLNFLFWVIPAAVSVAIIIIKIVLSKK